MRRISIFVLDSVDRLAEIGGWFGAFERFSVSVQLWVRKEDISAARFLAPSAAVIALDPRLWTTDTMRSWWSEAFAPAFAFDPDQILVAERDLSHTLERLLFLFPTRRITAWLPAHPYRDDCPEPGDIDGLRLVVSRTETLRQRLGIRELEAALLWMDGPGLAQEGLEYCVESGFGPGGFIVADLGTPAASLALAAGSRANDCRCEVEKDVLKRIALVHDVGVSPVPFIDAMGSRGFVVQPVSRSEVGLRLRASLVYLSWGYIGFPTSAECFCAKMFYRPILQWRGAPDSGERIETLQNQLSIDCSNAETVAPHGVTYQIAPNYIAGAMDYLLEAGGSGSLSLDPSMLSQTVRKAMLNDLCTADHRALMHGLKTGRQTGLERLALEPEGSDPDETRAAAYAMTQAWAALE